MTDSISPVDPSPAGSPPPPMSLTDRMVAVVTAPRRAMAALQDRPAWLVPAAAIFVLMVLYTAVNMHILMPAQTEMQIEHASAEQVEILEQQLDMFSDPAPWLRLLMGLGAGLSVVLFTLLVPGLLLHLFLRLSEGKGELRHTLGVICWAGLIPYALRTVLSWVVLVIFGSTRAAGLTLTMFMPDPNPQSMAYVAAGIYGDPFMYWMLYVVVLGIATVHKLTVARSAIVVAATYLLLSAVPVGMAMLGQMVSGR